VVSLGWWLVASVQAQVVAGRTAGEAGVAPTGAARYVIPLALPPGTNGLAPALAITYDSHGGNGLLGVGFRLSGLSVIRRCGTTLAQDGRISAVALDASDRFCLDGQRLRLTSGTYGVGGSRYQTEVESFARVHANGTAGAGPAWFRVEGRDGLTYEYGLTGDSRVESASSATPREWALNRIRDRDGNYVSFVYAESATVGSHRPLRIDYTGNLTTGAAPYYSVRFAYDTRSSSEVPNAYVGGGPVSDAARLVRIEVVHVATDQVVRSYQFSYDNAGPTGRSRLAALQECAGEYCLAPTQFSWSSIQAGWMGEVMVNVPAAQFPSALPGDVDGDGLDDLTYHDATLRQWMILRGSPDGFQPTAVSTGFGSDSDPSQAIAANLDGDGRRDILVPGSGNYWHVLRRTGTSGYSYVTTGVLNTAPAGGLVAADVDGDGRDDLVYVNATGSALLWRRNQTVAAPSFAAEAVLWTVPVGTRLPAAPFVETAQRFRSLVRNGDFNGDGRVDLLVLAQQGTCGAKATCATWVNRWMVLGSTGSALAPQYSFDGNTEALLADLNGDGLTDIAYSTLSGNWQMLLGTGTRGSTLTGFAGPWSTLAQAPPAGGRAMVVDWDADSRADLLQPDSAGELRHCRSIATSIQGCQPTGIVVGTAPSSPMALDVNGDGQVDVAYTNTAARLHVHRLGPPDVLVAVTDGLGARSEFAYAPLSSGSVHRASAGSAYPVRDLARGSYVVSGATRVTSRGPQSETYFYEGAKAHVLGRGSLGFARRTTVAVHDGVTRIEDYLQDPAAVERVGAPSSVTLQQRSGQPLARTTFTWGRHTYGIGYETRSFGYPSSIRLERFELDGVRVSSTVTSGTFDTYGTLVQRQVLTTEHAKGSNPGAQHLENTVLGGVVHDTTNWCLGRPASIQVTRQHGLPGGAPVTRNVAHAWDYLRCRATQQTVEPSSATLRVTTDFAYDAYGNVGTMSVTPAAQPVRTTSYAWIDNGRFLGRTTNAEGHVETMTWDAALARPTSVTDPNSLVTTLQHDPMGRLVQQARPDGTSLALARESCGATCARPGTTYAVRATERGAGGVAIATLERGFDAYERELYEKQDQPGGRQSFRVQVYDARGQLAQQSIPAPCCATPSRWITHRYDLLGRRTSTERPTSEQVSTPAVTRWRYDGLAVTETDALGRNTIRRTDALGRVLQVVDPGLTDTDYEYDAFGNLVMVRDTGGTETLVSYDVRGFRRSIGDPNAGQWTYDYLPLGELRSQVNPRGQATSFTYDRLSRPLTRTEPEGTTTWTWGNNAASRNVGSLAMVSSPGFQESYQYDSLGRPTAITTTIAGATLVTRSSYDPASGALDTLTYPAASGMTPLRVRHHYDRGRLVRLSDADSAGTYWQLNAVDSADHRTDETLGNGVRIVSTHDAVSGHLRSRTAGLGSGSTLQNLGYAWDSVGNLTLREERNRGVQEQFFYDGRDRLDYVLRGGAVSLDLDYDDAGNLAYKSDIGQYRYDTVRRHAVVAAGANTYAYDANGAVVRASGTTINWLSHDLPSQLTHPGGNYSAFYYGPDRERYRQVANAGGVLTETLYAAGGLYERLIRGSVTSHRHYIVADGRRVAVQTRQAGAAPVTVYLLEDHLGGVDGFTSASGTLLTRTSYQPFGARRSGDWLSNSPTTGEWQHIQATTPRGFTDHEHLDNLGLVHMNGRVYDPALGRFLSPDPLVQASYDTQGLNRYAYVRNNPLRYVDPSGLCTAPCMEEVVVTGSRLPVWQLGFIRELSRQSFAMPRISELDGGGAGDYEDQAPAGLEEVVVTDTRLPPGDALTNGAAVNSFADSLGYLFGRVVRSPTFGDMLIVGGLVLALIEPTPLGEMSAGAALVTSESRALSVIRYTHPGETFVRYESGSAAFSRITTSGGVRIGTYAAPRADGLVDVTRRASVYNLPDPLILRTQSFMLRPPPNTMIIGPRPVAGGTGNEVLFPWGF